jgi:hypothetical protein
MYFFLFSPSSFIIFPLDVISCYGFCPVTMAELNGEGGARTGDEK